MAVRTYNFYLDSEFANTRSPATDTRDVTFYLKKPIQPIHPTNRFRLRVNSVELPFSFSQVNSSNNTMAIKYVVGGVETSIGTITVPTGNYDIVSLAASIDAAINALASMSGKKITTTFDQSTGRCTFVFTDPASGTLRYYWGTTILLQMIGFATTAYVSIPATTGAAGLISNKNVNVCPTTCVYLSSRSFSQNQNYEALTDGLTQTDVIGKIQLTTLPQTYLMYLNYSGEFIEVNNKSITDVNIYLSTNLVDSLDMNDMRWSIHIIIEEMGFDPVAAGAGAGHSIDSMTPVDSLLSRRDELIKALEKLREDPEFDPNFDETFSKLSNDGGSASDVNGQDQLVRDNVVGSGGAGQALQLDQHLIDWAASHHDAILRNAGRADA
jgi:hypothetical protein